MHEIRKLFVANRGEIVCRIVRTARRMGIATCGVYTPQDARSLHVRILDERMELPAGVMRENYLNQQLLIDIALRFGAQALHPGYGFLSENAEFAERVLAAGMIWVGPRPAAMKELSGKTRAKEIAEAAGVPVAPWIPLVGPPDAREGEQLAQQIGLPFLIKATEGGGGRGQRVVRELAEFAESVRAARSEAERSFGSSNVFVEKFFERPRHVEVQVIADEHGHVFALGERDCTIQRRNQKLIEEAPAPAMSDPTRQRLHESARSLAAAAGYTNAGTVEFLMQDEQFYFMEVNTRLQVEHPVTEMTTGLDLVELQLRVATGEDLRPLLENHNWPGGHAIEVRLCAEDPANNFLPTPGPLTDFAMPADPHVRLETGFEPGDIIAQEYDSMFAKVIVSGATREEAIDRMVAVLNATTVAGFLNNKQFLSKVLSHPDFRCANVSTRWIDAHPELRQPEERLDPDLRLWAGKWRSEFFVRHDPIAPEAQSMPAPVLRSFLPDTRVHGQLSPQDLTRVGGWFQTDRCDQSRVSGWITRFELCVSLTPAVEGVAQRRFLFAGTQGASAALRAQEGPIVAQVPGVVLNVRAHVDQVVAPREPIVIIEAMKMEMPMSLPVAAKIRSIHVKAGDRIKPGQTLVVWERTK